MREKYIKKITNITQKKITNETNKTKVTMGDRVMNRKQPTIHFLKQLISEITDITRCI